MSPAAISPSAGPQVLSVPPDVPTTGPNLTAANERPPVMPVEATQHTPAGARAFAIFFIKTIDWGYATMSGAYLRHFSSSHCATCLSLAHDLDDDRRNGHVYIGGRSKIRGTERGPAGRLHSQIVRVSATSFEEMSRIGKPVAADPAYPNLRYVVWFSWSARGWRTTRLALEQ
jgi:hypothetical protein